MVESKSLHTLAENREASSHLCRALSQSSSFSARRATHMETATGMTRQGRQERNGDAASVPRISSWRLLFLQQRKGSTLEGCSFLLCLLLGYNNSAVLHPSSLWALILVPSLRNSLKFAYTLIIHPGGDKAVSPCT